MRISNIIEFNTAVHNSTPYMWYYGGWLYDYKVRLIKTIVYSIENDDIDNELFFDKHRDYNAVFSIFSRKT